MHDLGGIVWIIIVAIAVFSSIRRNVARSRAARTPAAPPAPVPAVQIARTVQPAQPSRSAMAGFAMPPVDVPPPVAPPAPAPRTPFVPMPTPVGTSPIRGMFGGSATLVRAIVAAEVLGPPKALQENTSWSP